MKSKDNTIYDGTPTLQAQREYIILEAFEDITRFKEAIDKECKEYNDALPAGATMQIPINGLSSNLLTQYLNDSDKNGIFDGKRIFNDNIHPTKVRKILKDFEKKGAIRKINKKEEVENANISQIRKEAKNRANAQDDMSLGNKIFGNINKYQKADEDKYNEVMLDVILKLDKQLDFDIDSYDAVSPERAVQLMLTKDQIQKIINVLDNDDSWEKGGKNKFNELLRRLFSQ